MEKNIVIIQNIVDFIEAHLEEKLDLDTIADQAGYSKYHLHRMFAGIVGFPLHTYVQRRRLTEAAKALIFTDRTILDIALSSGYETQRSFTAGFRSLFRYSPQQFRKKREFYPLQLKFRADGKDGLRGDRMMEILFAEHPPMLLTGFRCSTRSGFSGIGKCWRKLHAKKHLISYRADLDYLIGLNDYSSWDPESGKQPAFDYWAAAEMTQPAEQPKGTTMRELPAGKYVVFRFRAKTQDSLQPVADYVYKVWFPQSTCQLNENARFDFAKYGESIDGEGKSQIEFWVPIRSSENPPPLL